MFSLNKQQQTSNSCGVLSGQHVDPAGVRCVCLHRLNVFCWRLTGHGMFEQSAVNFQQIDLIWKVRIPANSIEMKANDLHPHKDTGRSKAI